MNILRLFIVAGPMRILIALCVLATIITAVTTYLESVRHSTEQMGCLRLGAAMRDGDLKHFYKRYCSDEKWAWEGPFETELEAAIAMTAERKRLKDDVLGSTLSMTAFAAAVSALIILLLWVGRGLNLVRRAAIARLERCVAGNDQQNK